jgi:hypothetical protein
MKEFMLIFISADYGQLNLSPEESQEQMQRWIGWIDKLKAEDVYVEGRPLMPGGKTVSGQSAVITDGPFAEAKELVGGYFIVKSDSVEAASELAKGYPDFHLGGSVEVREVMLMP